MWPSAQRDLAVGQSTARPALFRGERGVRGEGRDQPLGELRGGLLDVVGGDPGGQVPDGDHQAVGAEGTNELGAFAEGGRAGGVQPREGVEQLLLGVRHDPAQVVLLRGLHQ